MNPSKLHQKVDFTGKNIFVGMDVHDKSWTITLFYEDQFLRTFTQPPKVDALMTLLHRDYHGASFTCGYEAGLFGFWIQREIEVQNATCKVFHPADIPHTGKRKITKRDAVDSRDIAQALALGLTSPIYVPSKEIEQDRSILRYRGRLQADIRRCKNQIRALLFQFGIEMPELYSKSWSKNFVHWLKETELVEGSSKKALNHMINQLESLRALLLTANRDIRDLQRSEKYIQQMNLLQSIPGIGPLSALTLIAELVDVRRFSTFRKMNSFVGLYPMEHSSGEQEYKGSITLRKNKFLRCLLVESAWIAVKHDPALTQVFQNLKQRMTAKRAIIKIARKLLSRIRFVLMNETTYEPGIIK